MIWGEFLDPSKRIKGSCGVTDKLVVDGQNLPRQIRGSLSLVALAHPQGRVDAVQVVLEPYEVPAPTQPP